MKLNIKKFMMTEMGGELEKRRRELAIRIRDWASDTGIVPVKAVRTDGKFSS